MFDKLEAVEARYEELTKLISEKEIKEEILELL